jgi:NAD(P)-dependent dehydrogenase (short-subunit alcohol dehydrogenase family)
MGQPRLGIGRGGVWSVAGWIGAALGGYWAWRRVRARMTSLAGQVALVTGSSRGLGFLLARELGREGCRVIICARDPAQLERARLALQREGIEVLSYACDVTDRGQVEGLVAEAVRQFGRLDIVVNNAGVIQVGPLAAMNIVDFHYAMAVMFWGTVHVTLLCLPAMRQQGGGRIVNITSLAAKVPVPHLLPYDSAKFAALGFSEGLRAELAREKISVTSVVPGLMRTGSHTAALFKGKPRKEYRWFAFVARLPVISMNAERAARRIVRAAKLRQPELVLGWPAKLLRVVKELLPGTTQRALGVVNRILPSPEGAQPTPVPGATLQSPSPTT